MTFTSLIEVSRDESEGFYIPEFRVVVDGAPLPGGVVRDISAFTYRDSIDEIDSVELVVNNWDPDQDAFKFIGADTKKTLADPSHLHRLFEPCEKTVEAFLGYSGKLTRMLKGTFTSVEPAFASGGPPTLTVRILNELHTLRRKKYTTRWPERSNSGITDSTIANDINNRTDGGRKRFPLPIRVDPKAAAKENPHVSVSQEAMYDIDFLLSRALRRGYVVALVEEGANPEIPERHIYFGPSEESGPVNYVLVWGSTLIDFRPTLTTAHQFRSVTVRGWDRRRREPFAVTASLEGGDVDINEDLRELVQRCDPREEYVVDRAVHDRGEAKDLAKALLSDRSKRLIEASGSTIGLPRLRAGSRILVEGIGERLSGVYFVTDSTHRYDDGGYVTQFECRREDPKGPVL